VGIEQTINWYLCNKEWMESVTTGDYLKYYDTMYS
jgi:dTDP-glucose 4,6-dehydratase